MSRAGIPRESRRGIGPFPRAISRAGRDAISRREIARDIARLCSRCRVRCREHSRVQPRGAASHAFSGAIAHAASRAASHATSHTFSHLFSLAGRPASRAAPASDASCQAIGGRNGSLSPRGERGISDDLAPRPQPLPRAVPAAGTSAECAAKLYWHPFRRHAGVDLGGSCLQRAEAIDGAKDSGAVLRHVRGRVLLRHPTPWAGRVRDTSPWTEPPVNAWAW